MNQPEPDKDVIWLPIKTDKVTIFAVGFLLGCGWMLLLQVVF